MRYFRLCATVGLICALAFAQGKDLRGHRVIDDVIDQPTKSEAKRRALGRRRRRRKSRTKKIKIKKKDAKYLEEGTVCRAIYDEWIEREDSLQFSKCIENPMTAMMINQNGETCLQLDRTDCKTTDGCMWIANMFAGSLTSKQGQSEKCVPDPCFRINNGQCTIQHTGGRCVWYTKAMNAARGFSSAGCYQSPCNNPIKNTPNGCVNSGNDFYKCSWCGSQLGCQNAELTSKAQCWNIGQTEGCNNCKSNVLSETSSCKSDQCKSACCQSPYCECIAARAADVALDIGNTVSDDQRRQ
ncbi:Hypothetical Protein FCC1311_049872 [Hondaea fermentalgiana]|uniref:Uncharacterized protein n=1 Tax=Hondaea fermentalgiana TaxID=2315210 RepID=A0A2R5GCR5_9STRA|nr:Hypothetical Protein FCC1311_049872 [Hondaea fermentalgiana]|eukprot:GBG28766.1 Hypothetical Protein FCC1311_049872 [Hondaea fermentalgiana]